MSNKTYNDLQQIHTFIVGQEKSSLLHLANVQSLLEGKNFVIHSVRTKTLLMFYMVQRKGFQLLEYVSADHKVNFTDGPALVEKIKANIKAQEMYWSGMMTTHVIELASRFVVNPHGNVPISWHGEGKKGIHTANQSTSFCSFDDQAHKWTLEPLHKIDVANLNADNIRRFREEANGKIMLVKRTSVVIVTRNESGPSEDNPSCWNLRCNEGGLFHIKYIAKHHGGTLDQWNLKANGLTLTLEHYTSDGGTASVFSVDVWNQQRCIVPSQGQGKKYIDFKHC